MLNCADESQQAETAVCSMPFCSGPPDFFHVKVLAVGLGVFVLPQPFPSLLLA